MTLREKIVEYSTRNAYVATKFASPRCKCGSRRFRLALDEGAGVAVRTCVRCKKAHPMGDGADYLDEAELEACECSCGADELELMIGVSLYPGSEDVRWLYVGARCPACGLAGVYGDWKNEFDDYRKLLAKA